MNHHTKERELGFTMEQAEPLNLTVSPYLFPLLYYSWYIPFNGKQHNAWSILKGPKWNIFSTLLSYRIGRDALHMQIQWQGKQKDKRLLQAEQKELLNNSNKNKEKKEIVSCNATLYGLDLTIICVREALRGLLFISFQWSNFKFLFAF